MAKIKIKNSVTAGSAPSGLSFGEMAVNITDKKIFIGNAVEGVVTLHDQQNVVTSINGSTGAVSNIAVTNAAQTFSGLQTFSTGVSAATIYAATIGGDEGGQVDFGNPTTNTSLTGGVAIDIYQNKMRFFEKGGSARGYYIDLSAGGAGVGTDLVGGGGAVTSVSGSGNGILVSPTTGAVVVSNTGVHSVNGATGAVILTGLTAAQILTTSSNVNATRYLTFVGGTGTTGVFIDDVTTPLTYNPQQGNIGAKKATFTTSANVITLDSATPSVVLTDGVNISTFGIDSFAANYSAGKFTVSNNIGITLSVGTVQGQGLGIDSGSFSYELPIINGKAGQAVVWPSSGSGLTWSDVVVSVNGETGSIIGVATYTGTTPFSTLQQFNQGISASAGSTFSAATVYIANSTANIDPLFIQHSTTGALKVSTTGQARKGSIKLGNANSYLSNAFIENSDGVVTIYQGNSTTGPNMISFSSSVINIPTTISGATFNGLVRSSSGISAAEAITGGSYIVAESGFRVGSSSINAQTDSYNLQSSDNGKIITVNAGTSKTITVPSGLPVGFNCTVIRLGSGAVSFSASGTTINSVSSFVSIASQHGAASLISYTTDVFNLSGNLA